MNFSKDTSNKIHVVTFLCSILVIVIHAKHMALDDDDFARYFVYALSYVIGEISVPMFFIVSGFFLGLSYKQNSEHWYPNMLKKKAYSLLIPYCLWNAIYALTYVPFKIYGNYIAGRDLVSNTCFINTKVSLANLLCVFGGNLFGFPANTPFWYIRNLMFIMLISPLFIAILRCRRLSFWLGTCMVIVYLFLCNLPGDWQFFSEYGLSFRSFCFCFIGAYLAFYPFKFKVNKHTLVLVIAAWLIMVIIATYYQLAKDGNCFVKCGTLRLQILLGCLTLWFSYDYIPALSSLSKFYVVKNHFFIYAAHYGIMGVLFCAKAQQIMDKLIGKQPLLFYSARIVITFIICIAGILLLRKYRQSWLAYLCGGRA